MEPDILPCSREALGTAPIPSPAAYLNCGRPPAREMSAGPGRSSWLQSLRSPKLQSTISPGPGPSPWLSPLPVTAHSHRVTATSTKKDGTTLLIANLVHTWQPRGLLTSRYINSVTVPEQKQSLLTTFMPRRWHQFYLLPNHCNEMTGLQGNGMFLTNLSRLYQAVSAEFPLRGKPMSPSDQD